MELTSHATARADRTQIVVMASVLAHRANLGFEELRDLHLSHFNGQPVRSLSHLVELVSAASTEQEREHMRFEFEPSGHVVVVEAGGKGVRSTREW